jgi:hypothetical protein
MYVHFHHLNFINKWKECDRETERQKNKQKESQRETIWFYWFRVK